MEENGKAAKWASAVIKMPPLRHTLPGQPFRLENSEVVRWLLNQPDVMQSVFDKAKKYLRYNGDTGTWQGVDYEA